MNTEVTTRYGRQVKKPVRYEPVEVCTDDYTDDDYTSDEEIESETDEESDTDSDADEHGNLSNFVTYDDEEDEENVY